MGTDTPISPDSETTPEMTPEVEPETGEITPAVDSAPETAPAEVAESPQPEESAAEELAPVEGEMMPPESKKANKRVILMAAVFVLAIAVFAAVYFSGILGGSSDETASVPPVATTPTTPPVATTPTTPPTAAPPVAPPATTAPVTPPATATTPPEPAAPTLIPPGAPAFAMPIQSSRAVAELFNGGPDPPKIARLSLKWLTANQLSAALQDAEVEVSLNPGARENEVLLVGMASELRRARNVLARMDVPEAPRYVVASLPASIPTYVPDFREPPPVYPVLPIAPPPGRHAGWIYNNINGQVVAIFESRSGAAFTVQVGDTVDGMQVMSISPDTLVLRAIQGVDQGKEYRLKLQGAETFQTNPFVTATPATGTPAMPAWR
jgi:hypothetical protein